MDNGQARRERATASSHRRVSAAKRRLDQVEADWYILMYSLATGRVSDERLHPVKMGMSLKALERRGLIEKADVLLKWQLTERGFLRMSARYAWPVASMTLPEMRTYFARHGLS